MLIPTENYLVAANDGSSNLFNSSSSSVCIPNIPADDLSYTYPHQYAHAQTPVTTHRRERRMNSAPYPSQVYNIASGSSSHTHTASVVHDTDAFVFPETAPTSHAPEPLLARSDLVHPYQKMNQIAQMMAFAPGAHGTILDPFTTNPDAQSTYADFGELTATCMAAAGAYVSTAGNASGSATPNAADHNRRIFEGQTSQEAIAMDVPSKSSYAQMKVPQLPRVPSMQPHLSGPFVTQGEPRTTEPPLSTMSRNIIQHQFTRVDPEPLKTFPTPSELMVRAVARHRKDMEAPAREAEIADRIKKAHKTEALRQGYTPVDPESISAHDKKRLYLDSLEQYVIYLHDQLRLVGVEPVPVERLTSSRGLSSRSIRTLVVYLQQAAAKKHEQRRSAEAAYNTLRHQLGAETGAGAAFPDYMQLAIDRSEATSACARQSQGASSIQNAAALTSDSETTLSTPIACAVPQFDLR